MGKNYKVEDVVGRKQVNGVVLFRIKWEGYPSWQNTWEPEHNVSTEAIRLWSEKQEARRRFKETRQQQQKAKEMRREFWWHETKIIRHYHDDQGNLLFEVKNQNRLREVSHQVLLNNNSRVLAKYYIQQAKRRKIY